MTAQHEFAFWKIYTVQDTDPLGTAPIFDSFTDGAIRLHIYGKFAAKQIFTIDNLSEEF